MGEWIKAVAEVGFPIACVLAMGAFIFIIYKNTTKDNKEAMAAVQARCAEREDKLYQQIEKTQAINQKAIDTIAHYTEKLDTIQSDINEIKTDIITIMAKDN